MAREKDLLLKNVIFFVFCVNFCTAILTKTNDLNAVRPLVKRSGYDGMGQSQRFAYNSVDQSQRGSQQIPRRSEEKAVKLKGEPSEERAAFYGSGPSGGGPSGGSGAGGSYQQHTYPAYQAPFPGPAPHQHSNGLYGDHALPLSFHYGGNSLEPTGPHEEHHHKKHHVSSHHKSLAIKGLLIPLVGVALLGAAAAFVTNPILLQLGVITGRRRRRDVTSQAQLDMLSSQALLERKLNEIAALEKYMTQIPKEEAATQEKLLFARYLTCSGLSQEANQTADAASCLERLTCELHHPASSATPLERHVMAIVTSEILTNEYVPVAVKQRVKVATSQGADAGNCADFPCYQLESH